MLPTTCIYEPTCSVYSMQAILRFGLIKGVFMTIGRLFRCTPFHKGGIDAVPENLKGDTKWVL